MCANGAVIQALGRSGFTGVRFTSHYAFKCDQIGRTCPCCGNTHEKNSYYVSKHEPSGNWYVKNFSKKCVSKKFHTESLSSFAFSL